MTEFVATIAAVVFILSLLTLLALLAIVAWRLFSARVETRHFDVHGLPEPTIYPEMPPFRFVGMSEKGRALHKHRSKGAPQ
jgi:hypothetical protein